MKNPYAKCETPKARKALLVQLSISAKARAKALDSKTNDVLLADYLLAYKGKKEVKFHSYKEWGKKGYKVTKGKGWLIWSDPIPVKDKPEAFWFAPAHVWSSLDVVKFNKEELAKYKSKN